MTWAGTTIAALAAKVQTKLKDTTSTTLSRINNELYAAIREILSEGEWPFNDDMDNFIQGTGDRVYSLQDTCDQPELVRVASAKSLGTTSTQITTSNTGSTTWRYTYTGVGTDPHIGLGFMDIGDIITTTGFTGNNNLTLVAVTSVGSNYFEVIIASGASVETKTNLTISACCRRDAVVIRRTDRRYTAEQTLDITNGNAELPNTIVFEPNPLKYSIYDDSGLTKLEFSEPIASTSAIWYDFKPTYIDAAASPIPPNWDHVTVQLAYANMLELDDDSRATGAYQRYQLYMKQMKNRFFYSESEQEVCIQPGGFTNNG